MNIPAKRFEELLRYELKTAFGCTEPVAIAYCAAKAREVLGAFPDRMRMRCSSNVIKNAKAVVVPGIGGQKGIEAAAIAGALGGDSTRGLEALKGLPEAQREEARRLAATDFCRLELLEGSRALHILCTAYKGASEASVEIADSHLNVIAIEKDGEILFTNDCADGGDNKEPCADFLTLENILEYSENADLEPIRDLLQNQMRLNEEIAREGLENPWGANVGKTLLRRLGNSVEAEARAMAAAGSDARMAGCELPVVIVSGSGNQGLTVSVPVMVCARACGASEETLFRALLLSNLVALHIKDGVGRLSAYCGVVCAAAGSGAAITWLKGGGLREINDTVINTLANVSGMVCDGAKAACAAKIAAALDAAFLGHYMAMEGTRFAGGDGIVKEDAERTIDSVARLAKKGMRETDTVLMNIVIGQ